MRGIQIKRAVTASLALVFAAQCAFSAAADNKSVSAVTAAASDYVSAKSYNEYISAFETSGETSAEINIKAAEYSYASGEVRLTENGTLETGSDSLVGWSFEAPESGFYNMLIKYYPTPSKGGAIERTFYIDESVPFKEASFVSFSRVYKDGEITVDARNNDIRPEQTESPEWRTYILRDTNGYIDENLKIYLEKGKHTLTAAAEKELLELDTITFCNIEEPKSYEEYIKKHGEESGSDTVKIEAELTYQKSGFTVYPVSDKSSSATTPQDPVKIRLNTIGGDKWAAAGQWISWQVDIPESGNYYIAPRYKQDAYAGGYVSRRLLIDGECPFKEAQSIRFNYSDKWKVSALGDDSEDYLFWFDKGVHTVTMQVVLGDMAEILGDVQSALDSLQADYRRILIITGTSPDIYRDYGFKKLIPDVLEDMKNQSAKLKKVIERLKAETNVSGNFTVSINKLIIVLDKIEKDPEKISEMFNTFKDNLSSLGTWIQDTLKQPLLFDCIYFVPKGSELPTAKNGFLKNTVFKIKAFILSFSEDYQSFASDITEEDYKNNNVVKVWMTTGREQSQIMQQLSEQYFTPANGIKLNIQLVAAASLLPATLAGVGPDAAMSLATSDPINYAIRGAAVDLRRFSDIDEVLSRFDESMLMSYSFGGGVYALPETMTFPVMFYRTDILSELGLKAPETWDEFYDTVLMLKQQNLTVGYPVSAKPSVISNANLTGLEIFLYQSGGTLYNDKKTASNMANDINLDAFERMCELFTLYKLPVEYDFANRFRSGEMPLGIADYTMYNQLTIFASEIKGLWKMTTLPGTVTADGSINNTAPVAGTGIIMLSNSENKEKTWEFMKWVTSAEIQSRYATEVESILGPAAKQATANIEALGGMSWTAAEYKALSSQMANLTGTPEIPGGYYTARAVDFAFAAVYANNAKPVTAILDNVNDINDEIMRKRREFGLEK